MPAPAIKPIDIANRLRPVLLHLNRHLRREVHTSGVSPGQLSLLGLIEGNRGIGLAELAAREGTSMPSICSHIDRLEASGLVTRSQAERDRRRVDLEVTPEGERVLKVIRSKRTAWLSARLTRLADTDLAAVAAAIAPLEALLEQAE
ncbi:MAG: MarR family winged helix-turn-helix transcriptional regulator [Candidatus Dormibacteria bacterium]|nr:MarR family transcriptional regulator [Candidatus Saccharimonadales bacterium]